MPKVSVVMAGRNSKPALLKEAIDSVLNQTFQDFEFIFVDDGSNNLLEPIIRSISCDERIVVYRIEPSGLGAALNYGISKSHGDYIARLDDDDLMLPTRLERQVTFLDRHEEVSCVGTWFYDIVGNKYLPHRAYPAGHEEIVQGLLSLHWGLAHTTVMYRKKAFEQVGGYRIAGGGQDLDLFLQLGSAGKLANVGEYLTCYRMSVTGLGTVNTKKYEAYLFALEDVLKNNTYPRYNETINRSIVRLKNSMSNTSKTKYLRKLMVWRVKLLGKNFNIR